MSGPGKYAAPQLAVHLREADGKIWVSTQVQHPNSLEEPRRGSAEDVDGALEFIAAAWAASSPERMVAACERETAAILSDPETMAAVAEGEADGR